MKSSFFIRVDVPHSVVHITMSGFFDTAEIAAFFASCQREFARLRCGPNRHLTLIDMRGFDIQSQDAVEQFRRVVGNSSTAARRLAIVVSKSLARLQIKRITSGRCVAFFTSPEDAMRWLEDECADAA
jgi:hypothetical protein